MASGTKEGFGNMIFIMSIALYIGILDRITKIASCISLSPGQSVKVLPDIFHITLVLNKGSAFGLFKEGRPFFIASSIIAIIFIVLYVWKNKIMSPILRLGLGLILGGAAGNLIDRLRFGYVIDFLDFRVWPVFNVADSAITVGVAILILKVLRKNLEVKSKNHN